MALQEDIKPVTFFFLFKRQKCFIHVTLKGINLCYLAQMAHLKYYTQFGTGHFKANLGKR